MTHCCSTPRAPAVARALAVVVLGLALATFCGAQISLPADPATAQRWEREKQESWERMRQGTLRRVPEPRLEHSLNRVVVIRATFGGAPSLGAGVVIGRDKDRIFVVTANHVVRRAGVVADRVDINFRRKPAVAREATVMVENDPERDFAVLSLPATSRFDIDLCADSFYGPDAQEVERGLTVFPAGHPNGMRWMLPAAGDTVVRRQGDTIQFQSQVLSPGHSGGALLDGAGKWIGLITADAAPFGSAVAAEVVVRQLIQWQLPILLENNGFRILADAIARSDAPLLASKLDVCDPNEAGALGGPRDDTFELPVILAMKKTVKPAVLKLLLAAGADPNVTHAAGETPLHMAMFRASVEPVQDLLAAGADPNLLNWSGYTPLMFASAWNRLDVAALLMAAKADVNLKGKQGQTALNRAETPEMTALLRAHGAR